MSVIHEMYLEDIAARLICVLALDRFGDFVSDEVIKINENIIIMNYVKRSLIGKWLVHNRVLAAAEINMFFFIMPIFSDVLTLRYDLEGGLI